MSQNAKDRVRLNVEALEGRQLLSAHLTSSLSMLGDAVRTTQTGIKMDVNYTTPGQTGAASTSTYAVLSLRNRTNAALHFQFRWTTQSTWTSYTLAPGTGMYLWLTGYPAPQVRFAANAVPGSQPAQYNLKFKTLIQAAPPGWNNALHYNVTRSGNTLAVSQSAT